MIDWIFKRRANTIVYIFYSPWLLMLFMPLTPWYGDLSLLFIPVSICFWIQMVLYYNFTFSLVKRLIELDTKDISKINIPTYSLHTYLNIVIFTLMFTIALISESLSYSHLYFFVLAILFLFSEIFRASAISKLIVDLEQADNKLTSNRFMTLFLVINPLLGLWNLHARIKRLLGLATHNNGYSK
jgi:hypothetical protein